MTHEERKELIHQQHELEMRANKEYERKLRERMAMELDRASFVSKDEYCVLLDKAKDIVLHQRLFDYDEQGRPILGEKK